MGFFSKLFTALNGAASEAGEAVLDTQAMRILDQEIREAKSSLDEAKENLTKVIAQQMGIEREVKRYEKSLAEYESYAMQALEKGDEKLAGEIAERIAEVENELEAQRSVLTGYNNNISTLKQTIYNTERNIKSMEREIGVVKTANSVQKANEAIAAKFSGTNSALRTATDSLERVKKKQQEKADQMTAALQVQKEESGDGLQDKLRSAGIISSGASANSVLERFKAKQNKSHSIPSI